MSRPNFNDLKEVDHAKRKNRPAIDFPMRLVRSVEWYTKYGAKVTLECGHVFRYVGDGSPKFKRCRECAPIADSENTTKGYE